MSPQTEPGPAVARVLAQVADLRRTGDLAAAVEACEAGLKVAPDDPDILAALAGLAEQMAMPQVAADLWAQVIRAQPDRLEAVDGHARALRGQGAYAQAVDVLRAALMAHPEEPRLWTSLGVTLTQDARAEDALPFFGEALRLDGASPVARYNRGCALFDLGRLDAAAADFAKAAEEARDPAEATAITFAQSTLALVQGDLAAGWQAYEARFSPHWPKAVTFDAPGRRWTPADDLAGRRLLVLAEQGLGDELMFANLLPDVARALGPDGQLSLAVEPRLVALFQRSFPDAEVTAHATRRIGAVTERSAPDLGDPSGVDLWAPMGALLQRFRGRLEDFPSAPGYLRPDPGRVAHWRAWLGAGPPAIGLTWRSGKGGGDRQRQYPSLEAWAPVLATPGVRFVNLQYGDTTEELPALAALAGQPILQPPGLDLRDHIDDLAALLAALHQVVSVSNATGALAGAVGAELMILGGPASWPRLGTDRYPWYPAARVAVTETFGEWADVMAEAAGWVAR